MSHPLIAMQWVIGSTEHVTGGKQLVRCCNKRPAPDNLLIAKLRIAYCNEQVGNAMSRWLIASSILEMLLRTRVSIKSLYKCNGAGWYCKSG